MISRTGLFLALALLATVSASAAPAASPQDARPLAADVRAPDAEVQTVAGEATSLHALLGGKPTVLIFYRGGWCPFCNKHLAALAEAAPELRAQGYQLLALSPDAPAALQATVEKLHLDYRLASDRAMHAADAFGIAFRVDAATVAKYREYRVELPPLPGEPDARWLPVPAVFLVDRHGMIRFAHVNADYRVRLAMPELLAAARQAAE
jgi:peroxiredoxin